MSNPEEVKWVDSLKVNELKEELKKRGKEYLCACMSSLSHLC